MQNRSPHDSDFFFAEQCLEGNVAALLELNGPRARAAAHFLRGTGVPSEEAKEVVAELIPGLLTGDGTRPPYLLSYQGQCSLQTWLNRAAVSRAISRRRSEERYRKRIEAAHADGSLSAFHAEDAVAADAVLRQILTESIHAALTACSGDDFVIIHLLFGTNLHATEVARMFRCDWRTLRNQAEAACAQVRFAIQLELQRRDPWLKLSWRELVGLLSVDLPPLFGSEEPAA